MSLASRIGSGRLPVALLALSWVPIHQAEAQVDNSQCAPLTGGRPRVVETDRYRVVSVSPLFRINLVLEIEDWPKLRKVLQDFATAHGWFFRDQSEERRHVLKRLYITLCAENGLRFRASEQRWASRGYASASPGYGLPLPLYGDVPDDVWQPVAVEMVQLLESHWPNRVRFRNGDGYIVERPDFLDVGTRQ